MIYTIGETVFDIVFKHMIPIAGKVGGSALNTAVSLAHLGTQVAFVSEMGTDTIGKHCKEFLTHNGVGTTYITQFSSNPTSLALAFLNDANDARYEFFKQLPQKFTCKPIPFSLKDFVLFSSSFAISERVREPLLQLLYTAQMQQSIIIYDPNIRKQIPNNSRESDYIQENFTKADIVRASDEDCMAIFGHTTSLNIFTLLQTKGVKVFIVTKNSNSVELFTTKFTREYSVPKIVPVSTIGAGDTFNAGLMYAMNLFGITHKTIEHIPISFWDTAIPFAIACSAKVCMSLENYIMQPDVPELCAMLDI